ncbi:hypothetical protein W97_03128 [Coniosporium apollinis CBS 100218]|uniref:Zn(2)-C6 fungal-type domain-containing protein n=1 Tax=Coniosporium apollinis (strain CBS 100218) TaxID=1168221 RepID=R7YPP6_CONA1|nr:uncharacterized protein W97_03128 [Coniosporium apollinis CBS 100218]EON63900.1 hypothetical protein W97_03128 [Coniosporium apollinis CBS 100218]
MSSSSQPSPTSSDSTTNTPTFSFHLSYVSDASPTEDVAPKIEELEDDELEDMKVLPLVDGADASPNNVVAKRPRGRPRKHPISPQSAVSKTPKGRSKTGCITCRRRKKKCDETKPICVHCQKNNVHCEGYPPRAYWKSGKQRAEEGSECPQALGLCVSADRYKVQRPNVEIPRELPVLIEGVETDIDRFFLQHFNLNLSKVLTLFTEKRNPFNEVLLPMALRHKGLMHSLLCLSGSHLSACEPTNSSWGERQYYHFQCAIENLHTDENMAKSIAGDETAIIDDPTVAQTLVLCLKSICAGEVHGEYRPHMDAARHLIQKQKSRNQEFQGFLIEFFVYHDVSNSLTSLDRHSVLMMEDFKLPEFMIQPESGALLGVVDGLFGYISKIRQLRDRIRTRRKQDLKPLVDYDILSDAQEIDAALRDWVCCQPADTPRWIASMLYRQCTWLYLHRTILPSVPNPNLRRAVDQGLLYLQHLPPDSSTQSILLMPTFLLGCAAFHAEQRPRIQQAFADLQAYSQNGNITHAKAIVEKVWEMIDEGHEEESWDWESIMEKMGLDFLVT